MRKNSLTKALAAVAVSAIAVSSVATVAYAADPVQKNTVTVGSVELTVSEAQELAANGTTVAIPISVGSEGDGVRLNSISLSYYYDSELTAAKTKGQIVEGAILSGPTTSNLADGTVTDAEGNEKTATGIFLAAAWAASEDYPELNADVINDYETNVLYTFNFQLPADHEFVAGESFPVEIHYNTGDRFTYGEGTSEVELADEEWSFANGITNGGITIVADETDEPTTTTTAAPADDTTTTTAASTTAASTTAAATTTAKATTTTAKKTDSPKTGVAGAGVAVAGLAIAAGTAFVLRKKED